MIFRTHVMSPEVPPIEFYMPDLQQSLCRGSQKKRNTSARVTVNTNSRNWKQCCRVHQDLTFLTCDVRNSFRLFSILPFASIIGT